MALWRKPLGAGALAEPRGRVTIVVERCKGCGFCVEFCPRGVLAVSTSFNRKGYHPPEVAKPDLCCDCTLCQTICPDFAIWVEDGAAAPAQGGRL